MVVCVVVIMYGSEGGIGCRHGEELLSCLFVIIYLSEGGIGGRLCGCKRLVTFVL